MPEHATLKPRELEVNPLLKDPDTGEMPKSVGVRSFAMLHWIIRDTNWFEASVFRQAECALQVKDA
eukprot:1667367-Amphidinium_carterae.1